MQINDKIRKTRGPLREASRFSLQVGLFPTQFSINQYINFFPIFLGYFRIRLTPVNRTKKIVIPYPFQIKGSIGKLVKVSSDDSSSIVCPAN